MPSQSPLPPEIHDDIIDFLFDDKKALASCSRVCSEWTGASQYHLLHTIEICHPTKLSDFNSFLRTSEHLRSCIRNLTLHGSGVSNGTSFDDQLLVTAHDVSFLASHVPRLESLSIDGMWWSDTTPASAPADEDGTHAAPRLRRLSIRKVFTTPGALLDTLCLFPAIDHLDLERIYWVNDTGSPAPCAPTPPAGRTQLGALRVGPGSTHDMLRCFLPLVQARTDVGALRALALEFEHVDAWGELLAFLQAVAPHLRQLRLKFGRFAVSGDGDVLKDLKLSSLSALQSFEVGLPGEDANAPHPPRSWTLLHSLLPLLPSSVCDLTVVHKMHLEVLQSRLGSVDWRSIDDLLAGPAFGALADVTIRTELGGGNERQRFFCFSSDDLWDYLEENLGRTEVFFKEKLPQLSARGVLSIQ